MIIGLWSNELWPLVGSGFVRMVWPEVSNGLSMFANVFDRVIRRWLIHCPVHQQIDILSTTCGWHDLRCGSSPSPVLSSKFPSSLIDNFVWISSRIWLWLITNNSRCLSRWKSDVFVVDPMAFQTGQNVAVPLHNSTVTVSQVKDQKPRNGFESRSASRPVAKWYNNRPWTEHKSC